MSVCLLEFNLLSGIKKSKHSIGRGCGWGANVLQGYFSSLLSRADDHDGSNTVSNVKSDGDYVFF